MNTQQVVSLVILVVIFTSFGIIVGYKFGYNIGRHSGFHQALGKIPLNEKGVRKKHARIR